MTQLSRYHILNKKYMDVAGIITTKPDQSVIISCDSLNVIIFFFNYYRIPRAS